MGYAINIIDYDNKFDSLRVLDEQDLDDYSNENKEVDLLSAIEIPVTEQMSIIMSKQQAIYLRNALNEVLNDTK